MEHIISVTVENKFGVLSRVAGLFSGRGFNIESLSVAPTLDPSMSQMTIVTSGDEVKLAEAYGAVGLRANKAGDLDAILKEAIATDKPVVVDVPTYPYENCYPMIPAGGCNHEMILEDPPELKRRMAGAPSAGSDENKDTILTA